MEWSVGMDITFNGSCIITASELLVLCLLATHDWNGEQLLVDASIELEDFEHFLAGKLLSQVGRMSFLPKEFPCPKERSCLLGFPTDDAVPLIEAKGQITMAANPLRVFLHVRLIIDCWDWDAQDGYITASEVGRTCNIGG